MSNSESEPLRALVLVSGMHRSGTSATAGALTLLGADAGSRLAPPRPENPKGFFELVPLVTAHDEILARCGYTWDDPRPLDVSKFSRSFRSEARRSILAVLEEELSLDGLTVVKDPRASRLIPLWVEVFEELELRPRFIHAYRSPDEVSASLIRRSGMADGPARQLWLEHVRSMERDTRGFARSFVESHALVSEPVATFTRVIEQLDLPLPFDVASRRSDLEAFLESKMLHQTGDVEVAAKLSNSEAVVLKEFKSLQTRDVVAAQKRLDAIRPRETSTSESVAYASHLHLDVKERLGKIIERGALAHERLSDLDRRQAERLGQINAHLGRIDQSIERPEVQNLGALWRDLDELKKGTSVEVAKLDALETAVAELDRAIDQRVRRATGTSRNALTSLDTRLEATERLLHSEIRVADARQRRAKEILVSIKTEMDGFALGTELDEARSDIDETRTVVGNTRAELDETRTVVGNTRAELDETRTVVDDTRAELTATRSEIDDARAVADAAQQQISSAKSELTELSSQLDESEAARKDSELQRSTELQHVAESQSQLKESIERDLRAIVEQQEEIVLSLTSAQSTAAGRDDLIESLQAQLKAASTSLEDDLSSLKGQLGQLHAALQGQQERSDAHVDAVVEERVAAAVEELNGVLAAAKATYTAELLRFVDLLPTAAEVNDLRSRIAGRAVTQVPVDEPEAADAVEPFEVIADLPAFTKHWAPVVSIVIPAFNESHMTIECLRSIAANPPSVPFEILVGDDHSTEPEFENIRSIEGIEVVTTVQNSGFGANSNNAAQHARGEYLYFLNNDATLRPGSVDNLLGTFTHFPNTGIAGSKLVFPDGATQDAGGIIWRDGTAWNYARGRATTDSASNYSRVVDYVAGASLMIPRVLFSDLGGFDDLYAPAYYEDVDLCMKVAELDFEVRYQPASVIIHAEGRSYGTDVAEVGKHHQVLNAQKFVDRWQQTISSHRMPGEYPELEKDRTALQRILAVCPEASRAESAKRFFSTLKQLTELGHKVVLCALSASQGEAVEAFGALQFVGVEVVTSFHVADLQELLATRAAEFDAVLLGDLEIGQEQVDALRSACSHSALLFDTSVLEDQGVIDAHLSTLALFDGLLVQTNTAAQLGSLSDREGEAQQILTLPRTVDARRSSRGSTIQIVGSPSSSNNAAAEQWVIDDLIPAVASGIPGVDFQIFDAGVMDTEVLPTGWQDNLSPLALETAAGSVVEALQSMVSLDPELEKFQKEFSSLRPSNQS